MIQFAKERYGIETSKTNAAIFSALYEEGKNIGLVDTLMEVGASLNLPNEDELREYLESDEDEDTVKAEIEKGKRTYRISGVPFFVIQSEGSEGRPYGLSGAQSEDTFVDIFQELEE